MDPTKHTKTEMQAGDADNLNVPLSQPVKVTVETSNVPLLQPVSEIIDTSRVPLPESGSVIVDTSNETLPQSMSEIVDVPKEKLEQSVSEVANIPNESVPQPVEVDVDIESAPLPQSLSDIVDILIATTPPSKPEIIETSNNPSTKVESEITTETIDIQEVSSADISHVSIPQSLSETVINLNVTSDHIETEVLDRLSVPSPQSESEVVESLKSDSDIVNNLTIPSQNLQIDSNAANTFSVPLPQSVSEVSDAINVLLVQLPKPEVMDTLITSCNQSVVAEALPTVKSVNVEALESSTLQELTLGTSELIDHLHGPQLEPGIVLILNDPAKDSVVSTTVETATLKVPSPKSVTLDSPKFVETLIVPTMKAVTNVHNRRKTNFEAIFDDDDDDDGDTRKKLDASLVEHTSVMRGAIPVLPIALAYFCLMCNVLVPGLGSIFSGMFCLCFGIPRFGVHDGAKHRIGSLLINLLVGCGQLFTVLFCLVGWGWSIWWGVIMVKVARKYRKLKAEAMADEAEAPPVTHNNHTRA